MQTELIRAEKVVRPLSIHEASFPIYAELCPGGGNVLAVLELKGQLSYQQAQASLLKLMKKEPCLFSAITWLEENQDDQLSPAGYYFIDISQSEIDLPFKHFNVDTSEEFQNEVESLKRQNLNQGFNQGQLLWRAQLVSWQDCHTLIFCINHSISDGSSLFQLMKYWLSHLENNNTHTSAINTLPPALWHSMPKKIAGFTGSIRSLGTLKAFIKGQNLADKGFHFDSQTNVPISEHRCLVLHKKLNKELSRDITAFAKSHKKSLHGLIASALIQTLLNDCRQGGRLKNIPKHFSFPFVSTVDVRNKLADPIPAHTLGCFSSGVTSQISIDQDRISSSSERSYQLNPWSLAEQVTNGVKAAIKQEQHWKVLRIYQLAGLKGLKKMFLDSSEKPLATPISFANLGRIDLLSKNFQLTGYQAYAAFHASGAGISVVASQLNDQLTLCLTGPSPALTHSSLEGYADAVINQLYCWSKG